MAKKHMGALTMQAVLHSAGFKGMTAGNALAHRFCDAVEAGDIPDKDDLEQVAYALSILRWGDADRTKQAQLVARLLMKKKQGKAMSELRMHRKYIHSVIDYLAMVDELTSQEWTRKKAEIESRKRICARIHIGEPALKARIKKFQERAALEYLIIKRVPVSEKV